MDQTRTRKLLWELGIAALLAIAVFGVASIASTRPWGRPHDPEQMRRHADFAIEYALREVDATPEQVAQVKAIAASAIGALDALHEQHVAHRDALVAALSQPEISREALQEIRAQELALADAASVQLVDALADAAAALTPEQRTKLVELAREFHGHGD